MRQLDSTHEAQGWSPWDEVGNDHLNGPKPIVGRDNKEREDSLSSDATRSTYMKNVSKPTTWNTKDKRNIEAFLTEYETYCDVSGSRGENLS